MSRSSRTTHPRALHLVTAADPPRSPAVPPLPDGSPLHAQLERILRSQAFRRAHRSQHFLRYILHHAVHHPNETLKEYSIAIDVFDRDSSYDPSVNNTVRVEAGRLRSRLRDYYTGEGHADPLLIEVPKGSYRVLLHDRRTPHASPPSLSPAISSPTTPSGQRRSRSLPIVAAAFLVGAFIGYRAGH